MTTYLNSYNLILYGDLSGAFLTLSVYPFPPVQISINLLYLFRNTVIRKWVKMGVITFRPQSWLIAEIEKYVQKNPNKTQTDAVHHFFKLGMDSAEVIAKLEKDNAILNRYLRKPYSSKSEPPSDSDGNLKCEVWGDTVSAEHCQNCIKRKMVKTCSKIRGA